MNNWALEPIRLEYEDILIRTLTSGDVAKVAPALLDPDGYFGTRHHIDTVEKIVAMLEDQLSARATCNPLVYFARGEVAGITRLMGIVEQNKTVEVGGTWVVPRYRRTHVNTMVKHLLLNHVFETLEAERVEFMVDERNYTAQMGMLRIGATFEGTKRHRQILPNGEITGGHLYSIIRPEWPQLSSGYRPSVLPRRLETKRLLLSAYVLSDAPQLLDLVQRNRQTLMATGFSTTSQLASLVQAQAYIAQAAHKRSAQVDFCYGIKLGDQQIGQLQVKRVDLAIGSAELAYFIDEPSRRQGFAREAIDAIVAELFERTGLVRLFIRTLASNVSGVAVAENLGFEKQGMQLERLGKVVLYTRENPAGLLSHLMPQKSGQVNL